MRTCKKRGVTKPLTDLIDAALRERAEYIVGFVYARPGKRTEAVDGIMALVLAARAEQREADCRAICWMCRETQRGGPEAEYHDPSSMWWHGPVPCSAATIRNRRE